MGCAARVKELQGTLDKVAAAQAGLAAERQAFDQKVAAERAELDARESRGFHQGTRATK